MPIDKGRYRKKHRRARVGLASQDVVALWVQAEADELGVDFRVVGTATYGQKDNDVLVESEGRRFGVEVKGVVRMTTPIPIFDKSVRRRNVPADIESMAQSYIDVLSVGGAKLKVVMQKAGKSMDFLGMLDWFRDFVDPTIGLAEDSNSASSGKLPKELSTTEPRILLAAKNLILKNLASSKDSYFAIHDKSVDDVVIFFTGFGKNVLKAPKFPDLKRVTLDTYGGSSKGATRIAFKVLF